MLPKSTLERLNEALKESFRGKISVLFFRFIQQQVKEKEIVQFPHEEKKQQCHAIVTCYDDRLNRLVRQEARRIRSQGGQLREKDIIRPPGGVHLLAGHTDCRKAFYQMMSGLRDIAKRDVIHLFPHTNCQYCGIHFQEKLGNGVATDLRFHLKSAQKLLSGAMSYFASSVGKVPEIDVRIVLTTDQRIVTIDEAIALLPHVPEHGNHGSSCITHHGHTQGYRHGTPHAMTPVN